MLGSRANLVIENYLLQLFEESRNPFAVSNMVSSGSLLRWDLGQGPKLLRHGQSNRSTPDPRQASLTLGTDVRLCPEAEWTKGNIRGDSQGGVLFGRFE